MAEISSQMVERKRAAAESGNVTVSFEVLPYAGTVVSTLIADSDGVPDPRDELDGITWASC